MSISVLTIVRGRQAHLENVLIGLSRSHQPPSEWIVVGMDQDVELRDENGVRIRTSRVDGDGNRLPLAEARNRAAALCQTERMVFLDVDCIPSARMIRIFDESLADDPRLWMGSPQYLPAEATTSSWSLADLELLASPHPLQPKLSEGERKTSDRYEMFWSLCFAITKPTFESIGGFDESFDGYGGEDTDFAFAAGHAEVPFGFVGAKAFHQHHPVCKPPLNHFHAIIRNAQRFHDKWGQWPMESWLESFASLGLIEFNPDLDRLEPKREPTSDEIDRATSFAPAGF